MENLLQQLAFSYLDTGIFLPLFLLIKEFFDKEKGKPFHPHFYLVPLVAVIQFHIASGVRLQYFGPDYVATSFWFFGFLGIVSLVGPTYYRMVLFIFDENDGYEKFPIWHYCLPLAVLVYEIVFIHLPATEIVHPKAMFLKPDVLPLTGLVLAQLFGYFYFAKKLVNAQRHRYDLKYSNSVSSALNAPVVASVLLAANLANDDYRLELAGGIILTTASFIIIFKMLRYPDLFYSVKYKLDRQRYQKTSLSGINVDLIKKNLLELFSVEKIHHDFNVRSQDIAKKLAISNNQFSRIVNEHFGSNFFQLINKHRIDDAKKLLLDSPDLNALRIGFEVGYSSKSAFYKNFSQATGMTPIEFRNSRAG